MKTAIEQIVDQFEGRYLTTAFLPLSVAKQYHKLWAATNGKNRYAKLFEQFTTKRPAYRIYIPVASHLRVNTKSSPIEIEVINALHNYAQGKYDLLDYFSGKVLEKTSGRIMALGKVLETINAKPVKEAIAAASNKQIFDKIKSLTFTVAGDGKGKVVNRYQMFDEGTRSGIDFDDFLKDMNIPALVKVRDQVLKAEADKEREYQDLVAKMKAEGKGAPRRKDEPVDIAKLLKDAGMSGSMLNYFAGIVSQSVKAEKEGKPSSLPRKASAMTAEQKTALLSDAVIGGGQVWDAKLFKPRKINREFLEGMSWTPINDVINRFADDPIRKDSAATDGEMALVISRHPYDVASVSTGRAWTSCLNLGGVAPHQGRGSNAYRVPASIRFGSIAVYGIKADDGNIKKPVCRVTLMPFVNTKDPDDIILDISSSSNYGTAFPGFMRTLRMWLAMVNHGNKGGTYKIINTKPYADLGADRSWPSFSQDKDISTWCEKFDITKYKVTEDGFINVNGNVKINSNALDKRFMTLPIKFGEVTGDFDISSTGISVLTGCPKKVGGDFIATRSNITNLEDGPEEVNGNYLIDNCPELQNLVGFPKRIGGDFCCGYSRNLMSLRGISPDSVVEGSFEAYHTGLRRIDAFPQVNCKVTDRWRRQNPHDTDPDATGNVDFTSCDIQTTVGLPELIKGDLILRRNTKLEDLVGFPKKVLGHVTMTECPLHDLSHINGIEIGGTFQFSEGDLCDADVAKFKPGFIGGGIQLSAHRLTKKVKLPPNVKYGLWLGSDQSKIDYSHENDPKVFPEPFDQRPAGSIKSDLYKARRGL